MTDLERSTPLNASDIAALALCQLDPRWESMNESQRDAWLKTSRYGKAFCAAERAAEIALSSLSESEKSKNTPRCDAIGYDSLDSNDYRAWRTLALELERDWRRAEEEVELYRGQLQDATVRLAEALGSVHSETREPVGSYQNGWNEALDRAAMICDERQDKGHDDGVGPAMCATAIRALKVKP